MSAKKQRLSKGVRETVSQTKNGLSTFWKSMAVGLRILRRYQFEPSIHEDNTIKVACNSVSETLNGDGASQADAAAVADTRIVTTIRLHANIKPPASETTDRTLELHVIFYDRPVQNISATIEMLKRLDSALGKVKYLNMFIFPAVEDMEGTDEQMVSDVAELEILAKKLVELVPNVRYIRCTGPAMGIVSTAFQHNVISLLSSQLYQLRCSSSYISHLQCFSKQLLSLKLCNDGMYQTQPLQIRADRLRHLAVYNLDADFNWRIFESSDKPGYIDFCNIRHLHLNPNSFFELNGYLKKFVHVGPTDMFSYRINAPNLAHLCIKLNPLVFSILSNAKLPGTLRMLTIKDNNGLIFHLQHANTKRLVNDVFSKFTELGDDNMEYYDVINNLFGKHKIAKSIECVVKRQLRYVDFKDIEKLYITSLDLRVPILYTDFLALISRIPTLVDVIAHKVIFSTDTKGAVTLSELERETKNYSRLLPKSISHMHLATADGQHADEKTCEYLSDFMHKSTKALSYFKLV